METKQNHERFECMFRRVLYEIKRVYNKKNIQLVRLHVISSKLDSEAETNWLLYVHVMSWWSGGAGSGGVVGGGNIWNPVSFFFLFFFSVSV